MTSLQTGLAVQCEQLSHIFHVEGEQVRALDDVRLSVSAGESVAVLGPSGSGKSTLLTLLAGLRRPTSGHLFIGADDITLMPERELLRLRGQCIGVVVQNASRNLLPYGDAADNIRFAQGAAERFRRTQLPEPHELLGQLRLSDLAGQSVARMSGGEQQRLSVAVGMAVAPGLLLADEPTSQLDGANRDRVVALLRRITEEFGTTVITVTHDQYVAQAMGRTVTIVEGRADDRDQHVEQFAAVGPDGSVRLPSDVSDRFPPGTRLRVVRKAAGVELLPDEPDRA
jgi:putative ABC transport system ATP-binding protein